MRISGKNWLMRTRGRPRARMRPRHLGTRRVPPSAAVAREPGRSRTQRCWSEFLGLLGLDDESVGLCWCELASLVRAAVQPRSAGGKIRSPTWRPGLFLQRHQPRWPLCREWPSHSCAAAWQVGGVHQDLVHALRRSASARLIRAPRRKALAYSALCVTADGESSALLRRAVTGASRADPCPGWLLRADDPRAVIDRDKT